LKGIVNMIFELDNKYDNIRSIRPGYGLHPKYYEDILGKVAKYDVEKGTALSWGILNKSVF